MMKTLAVSLTFLISALLSLQAAAIADSIGNQAPQLGVPVPTSSAFKRLSEQLALDPTNPNLHYFMAITHAREGRALDAIAALSNTFKYGDGFLPPRGDYFAALEGESSYEALYQRFESSLASIQPIEQTITLRDAKLLPEGIAWDAAKKRLLVGSTYRRGIVSVDSQGRVSPFTKQVDRAAPVLGLAINQAKRILYAVISNGFLDEAKIKRRNAVVAYDLKKDRKLWQLEIPAAIQINDLAIHPNGDLAVTDSGAGIVFMIEVKGPRLVGSLFPSGLLRGVNGIAFHSSGKLLYIAHSLGISVWSNESNSLSILKTPLRETVAAIDGLYWMPSDIRAESALVGVQNVTNKGRVIRMSLNEQGDEVTELSTVLSHHHPAIDEPTTLALAGDDAFLLARTQVSRLQPNGLLKDPATLKAPVILKVKLRSR
jgi:hypothetical protein